MGKRRDLAFVPSTINATWRIFLKMTRYSPIFNLALQGTFNSYLQICIMNEELVLYSPIWCLKAYWEVGRQSETVEKLVWFLC